MVQKERTPKLSRGNAGLLEQVSRSVQNLCFRDGLHPVQWSALRYFSRGGLKARTVSGLANYQGTTLAPASRTISALTRKGYLLSRVDPRDRRSRRIDLTNEGLAILEKDPLIDLEKMIESLPEEEQAEMAALLERLLMLLFQQAGKNDEQTDV